MTQHRNSIHLTIRLSDSPALQKCVDNSTYRVMLFCAGEVAGVQHIAFPHQSELKVNGGDFKANLRGLKNKPGSTRPVDITNALRLRSSYTNNIEFTYALTTKVRRHLFAAMLPRHTPQTLTCSFRIEILPGSLRLQDKVCRRPGCFHLGRPEDTKGLGGSRA